MSDSLLSRIEELERRIEDLERRSGPKVSTEFSDRLIERFRREDAVREFLKRAAQSATVIPSTNGRSIVIPAPSDGTTMNAGGGG